MTEPAIAFDRDLDFTRYAPVKHAELVIVQPEHHDQGELEILGQHVLGALGLIGQCIRIALIILWRRAMLRLTVLYTRIAQSLNIAWALAGFGWGGFIAFPIIIHFAR